MTNVYRIGEAGTAVGKMADVAGAKIGKTEADVTVDLNGAYEKYADEFRTSLAQLRGGIKCDRMTGLSIR